MNISKLLRPGESPTALGLAGSSVGQVPAPQFEVVRHPIDNLPVVLLVPAAVVGVILGRFIPVIPILLFLAFIVSVIRSFLVKRNYRKQEQIAEVHNQAQALAANITGAVNRLEYANEELGFAEAKFGTSTMAVYRAALQGAYAEVEEAWRIQESLASYDGTSPNDLSSRGHAEELCHKIEATVAEQAAAVDSFENTVADTPKALKTMAKRIDTLDARATKSQKVLLSLNASDDNSSALFHTIRKQIAQAREAADNAMEANKVNDIPHLIQYSTIANDLITGTESNLAALDSQAQRLVIENEKAETIRLLDEATNKALEKVNGLGPMRRDAVLSHFRTLANLRNASQSDLERVPGVGPKLAEAILAALRKVR